MKKFLDNFHTLDKFTLKGQHYSFFNITRIMNEYRKDRAPLPYSIRVLLENMLRNEDGYLVKAEDVEKVLNYDPVTVSQSDIPFMPARVVLQDFTGVPAVVDLAALRDATRQFGKDPSLINPLVRADLVVDHSVQIDVFGTRDAFRINAELEFKRNKERYSLLKWAQRNFKNFSVIPPDMGIIHQVNLEYLAQVVMTAPFKDGFLAYPDTLIGTDSHTTMINGLSVLGWGVGGIEAEAVMLGQPYYMLLPEVVGVRLVGKLPEGATATDLVLTLTQMLRKFGVVGKFVEYFGPGLEYLSLPDRATIANMAPEYGATMGFFPIDQATLDYLRLTGRSEELIALVEHYAKTQSLFRDASGPDPEYSAVLELNLAEVEPSLAGPKRPQDRVPLRRAAEEFVQSLTKPVKERGFELKPDQLDKKVSATYDNQHFELTHGSVVLASITSCTNTSNPSVLIGAALLAKKAVEKGLKSKPWVKTSFAPGSRVVTEYLLKSGLIPYLEKLRFHLVGYGCATCIGNSGPLPEPIEKAIKDNDLVVAAVLSGNRNFEGRIHPAIKANYLASPPLVVAYALAGRMDIDFDKEALGTDEKGNPVYLKDIWPSQAEIYQYIQQHIHPEMYREKYADVTEGDQNWKSLQVKDATTYEWDEDSSYIKLPPFFENMPLEVPSITPITNARVLAYLGDSVTTDHISPAGSIPKESPAGKYLIEHGVAPEDFNSYGSRRGNHEVMMRGTFANIRIKNKLVPGTEGGWTVHIPSGEKMSIYDAAMRYKKEQTPLLILAGKEYGTGSSRDWAAKGTYLLGVKAVIAESFERIHRSNLVGMGVLPLEFTDNQNAETLGLTGTEVYHIPGLNDQIQPGQILEVVAEKNGTKKHFKVRARLDTPVEVDYYRNGGILQTVLRQIIRNA